MNMIHFAALGDISFNDKISEFLDDGLPIDFINPIKLFLNCNFVVGNLESPLVKNSEVAIKKKIYLSGNPAGAKYLAKNKISILSLANNHIFDYGIDGYHETTDILKSNCISYFGAGENIERASEPYIKNLGTCKIGFLGYCDSSTHAKLATKKEYGVSPLILEKCISDIKNLINYVNFIIISLHWGYERFRLPSPHQISIAHRLIDTGCGLILGHHPHVIQTYERYCDSFIFYSLGNYLFSDIYNEKGIKISSQTSNDNIYSLIPLFSFNYENGKVNLSELYITKLTKNFNVMISNEQETVTYNRMLKEWQFSIQGDNYSKVWQKYKFRQFLTELFKKEKITYFLKKFYRLRPHHKEIIIKYFHIN